MDAGSDRRKGQPWDRLREHRAGRGAIDPGLPLLAPDEEGGGGDPDLRSGRGDRAFAPLRDDAVRGATAERRARKDVGDRGGLCAGDERDRAERERRAKAGLQTLADLERAELPDVARGYWGQVTEGTTAIAEVGIRDGDVISTSKFDKIADRALDVLAECLDADRLDPDNLRLMNLRLAAAQTVINSRIKVDDTIYRRQQFDMMPKLIQMMEEEKEKLKVLAGEILEYPPAASPR